MPGQNGKFVNQFMGIDMGNDNIIDTNKEFKQMEETLKSDKGKEEFVNACNKEQGALLKKFSDPDLAKKIDDVTKKNKSEISDVEGAYLVLKGLKEGNVGSYDVILGNQKKQLERDSQKNSLIKTKKNYIKEIKNNSDWSEPLKKAGIQMIDNIFSKCNTTEEFEKNIGISIGTLEKIDNVHDFFAETLPHLVKSAFISPEMLFNLAGDVYKDEIEKFNIVMKDAIESGKIGYKEFVDGCKEIGYDLSSISEIVIGRGKGYWQSYILTMKEIGEDMNIVLQKSREILGKSWDKFVDYCGNVSDSVCDFGKMLVEKGELERMVFSNSLLNNREDVKMFVENLYEQGKIKLGEFIIRCKNLGEKGEAFLINMVESGKIIREVFAEFCKNSREDMKSRFEGVISKMLYKGVIALNAFTEWCKNAGELMKKVGYSILVGLCNIGKFTLGLVVGSLFAVGFLASEIVKGLVFAGKEIYKGTSELVVYIGNISKLVWEKMKESGKNITEFAKDVIQTCVDAGITGGKFVSNLASNIRDQIKGTGVNIMEFTGAVLNACKDKLYAFDEAIVNFVKNMREKAKVLGIKGTEFMKCTCEFVYNALTKTRNEVADFFKNLGISIETVALTIREVSKGAWNGCVDFVLNMYNNFTEAMMFLRDKCKIALDKIGEILVNTNNKVLEFIKYVKDLGVITYENVAKWCSNKKENITNFIKMSIENLKVSWSDLNKWCNGKIDKMAVVLREIYGKSKDGINNFIKFIGKNAIESGKILLKLGISSVNMIVDCLKNLGCSLKSVAELLMNFGKIGVQKVCDELYKFRNNAVEVGHAVAGALGSAANSIREWIYGKTKDLKRAIVAMDKYIQKGVVEILNWVKGKVSDMGIVVTTVVKALKETSKNSWNAILEGLQLFAGNAKESAYYLKLAVEARKN